MLEAPGDDAELAMAPFPPWAYKGGGKGKGGCGGAMVDRWRGQYVLGGYMAPDGSAFE